MDKESGWKKMQITTLCYIEQDGKYLMLHRTKKKHDINENKWIGVGGHAEGTEGPEECLLREVKEETGLRDPVRRPGHGAHDHHSSDRPRPAEGHGQAAGRSGRERRRAERLAQPGERRGPAGISSCKALFPGIRR